MNREARIGEVLGKASAISAGLTIAFVVVSSIVNLFTKETVRGMFIQYVDSKDYRAYMSLLDNVTTWRIAVIILIGLAARLIADELAIGGHLAALASLIVCALLLASWNEYKVAVACGCLILCSRMTYAWICVLPATILIAGFITRSFSAVPFSNEEVMHGELHMIGLWVSLFWMVSMAGLASVAQMIARRHPARSGDASPESPTV